MCQQLALSGHGAMSDLSLLCAPNPTSANQHSISSRVRTQGTTDTRATAHSYFAWVVFEILTPAVGMPPIARRSHT